MPERPLSIAILAHSVNPRGGVVHALALGEALRSLGHYATVHAPDAKGVGFFRTPACKAVAISGSAVSGSVADMVEVRVKDYLRHFERAENRAFDVWHAQDGISGNALANLKERGLIHAFARTVHHVDLFEDPWLQALQKRAILSADKLFTVSRLWCDGLARDFGIDATVVGNGVDLRQFSPIKDEADGRLRNLLPRGGRPVFLAIGGIEGRKNTVQTLQAFISIWRDNPDAHLVIAGGASLLDHSACQAAFSTALCESGLPYDAITILGPVPQDLMPALYRSADALVFPSLKEGFGLVVLEAMACGVPVITSHLSPFTEYLGVDDALWCDPTNTASIAEAMGAAQDPGRRKSLIERGFEIAAKHLWTDTALRHIPIYDTLREPCHA